MRYKTTVYQFCESFGHYFCLYDYSNQLEMYLQIFNNISSNKFIQIEYVLIILFIQINIK